MKRNKRKVYIAGAGPGDPGLITVKALKVLTQADCVIYDFLSNPQLLRHVRKNAELICAGKTDGLHLKEQNEINKLLYKKSKEVKVVVRLKGGDPFLFSRGVEEALYLKRKKVDFEIIPGVTSAFAAPESFGIPLTRKGKFSSVAILTGRKSTGKGLDAPDCDTLVYLMAVNNIREIVRVLLKSGRPKDTLCAFIEKATTEKERITTGTLNSIVSDTERRSIRPPAVFIVGEVINYGKKIYGYKFKGK